MIAIDTETTGLDFYHGARPFLVTTCRPGEDPYFWEWPVDGKTRQPVIPPEDLDAVKEVIYGGEDLVLQNTKFDVTALRSIIPDLDWPWERTFDTLIAEHIICSNALKTLDALSMRYLGHDIEIHEKALNVACNAARAYARKHFPNWRITDEDEADMPSAKGGKKWKTDMWLLKAIVANRTKDMPPVPKEWDTLVATYANEDSAVTGVIFQHQAAIIKKNKQWKNYEQRLKQIKVGLAIETYGLTLNSDRTEEKIAEHSAESEHYGKNCVAIAKKQGFDLKMPKGGKNGSLTEFVFGEKPALKPETFMGYTPLASVDVTPSRWMNYPIVGTSEKTGAPSMNEEFMKHCLESLPEESKEYKFLNSLSNKRKRDTAVAYMNGYKRFWLPIHGSPGYHRLHPNLNQTGTNTLRWSSSNPNEQNISKKVVECRSCKSTGKINGKDCYDCKGKGSMSFNLRYLFGPAPGREWYSLDAKNLELRLPAYESGEEGFIALFERPNDPPYFGSNHLMVAHILFPREFEQCRSETGNYLDGRIFKKRYESSFYTQVKRGNFAITCGAVEGSGTADKAFGVKGGQTIIKKKMTKMTELSERLVRFANKHGYVETIPDRTVDPDHGYPIMCKRSSYGKVVETTPFSYHIQGTAMQWANKCMTRCYDKLEEWRASTGFDGHIVMQGHDELVFDFPAMGDPVAESKRWAALEAMPTPGRNPKASFRTSNLWRIYVMKELMEEGGRDIGIPLPVSCEYHNDNWSEGIGV